MESMGTSVNPGKGAVGAEGRVATGAGGADSDISMYVAVVKEIGSV